MTDDDLDLVDTLELIAALQRRSDASLVIVQREVNGQDKEDRVFSYSGGLSCALGLARMCEIVLADEFVNGSEDVQ